MPSKVAVLYCDSDPVGVVRVWFCHVNMTGKRGKLNLFISQEVRCVTFFIHISLATISNVFIIVRDIETVNFHMPRMEMRTEYKQMNKSGLFLSQVSPEPTS